MRISDSENQLYANFIQGTILSVGTVCLTLLVIYGIGKPSIESGYADPSALEIKTADSNNNGKKETFIRYKGIDYPAKEERGRLFIPYTKVEEGKN
ncbi:hypothetical protein J4456_03485 [Candidatus Pacearchaeota archaeon]|nr:hypothetical protein [Candidatus Pacearchaeota archaeon]